MGRRRSNWSSNEYFAHKKNIGEEVKLKYKMITIDRSYGLTKDTMKHEFFEAKNSLKSLRKSTGHSIEALPPTPFQTFSPRAISVGSVPHRVIPDYEELPPEYRYLDGEDDVQLTVDSIDDLMKNLMCPETQQRDIEESNVQLPDIKNPKFIDDETYPTRLPTVETRASLASPIQIPLTNNDSSSSNERSEFHSKLKLPLIIDVSKNTKTQGAEMESFHQHELNISDSSTAKIRSNHEKYICQECAEDAFCTHQHHRTQTEEFCITIESKVHLDTGDTVIIDPASPKRSPRESKGDERDVDKRGANPNLTSNDFGSKDLLPKRKKETRSKKKDKNSLMRDIRIRCRTCRDRFRQNVEFQRRKKEREEQERLHLENDKSTLDKRLLLKKKSFIMTSDDLESIFSDEVLDFEKEDNIKAIFDKANRYRKGYSRKRLEQLAQPKIGRRRKLLFSKQLIKKEVDCLIESHSHPELTEKEKERLRMLQSKIQMFLAMMQNSLMPTKMVDIPQREDIMRVDISHH